MSEWQRFIVELAWPIVTLFGIMLAFLAFLIALPGQAGPIAPADRAASPQLKSPVDERRMIWWATFTALSAALLAISEVAKTRPVQIALWVSLALSGLKFFHWTHYDLGWTRFLDYHHLGKIVAGSALLAFLIAYILIVSKA